MQTLMLGIEGLKSQILCNKHKSWVNQPNIKRGLFRPLFFIRDTKIGLMVLVSFFFIFFLFLP